MRFLCSLLLLSCVALFACRKPSTSTPDPEPQTGQLEIVFKPVYQGAPMVFFEDIPTGLQSNEYLYFQKLEFFVAELKVQQTNNLTINLEEVDYVELGDLVTAAMAEEGYTLRYDNLPVGDYDELSFGVGLTDALNSMDPGDFGTLSPMSNTGRYWPSWNSYILSKVEGTYKQPNGNTNFVYHTGVDGMYQPRSFATNFSIAADKITQVVIHLHGEDLFFKQGQAISISDDNLTHSGAPGSRGYELAKRVNINIANALRLP